MKVPAALRIASVLVIGVAIGAACGGGGGSSGGSITPGAVAPTKLAAAQGASSSGSLIIADANAGLIEHTLKSGDRKVLIAPATADTFLLDPALSPDGKQLVYVVQAPPKIDAGVYDAGSDLWVANRDGSGARMVFEHMQPNQLVRFPQWQDNATILAVVQEVGEQGGVSTVTYVMERIPVAGGERTKAISDVLSFGLSPDGKRVAYARLAPEGGETLNVADLDGANDSVLVDVKENLSPFNDIRYSPDGTKIAFSSADQTGARAPSPEYVSAAPIGRDASPPVDGLPEDIWTVDVAGGRPARAADLKEDLPALAWSGDGKYIYVVGAAGLYEVNLTSGAVDRLGEGTFHGSVAWAP